eukprot:388168_1
MSSFLPRKHSISANNINEPTKISDAREYEPEQKYDNVLDELNAEIMRNLKEEIQLHHNNIQSPAFDTDYALLFNEPREYEMNKPGKTEGKNDNDFHLDDDVILFGSLLKIIDHINVTKHEQLNINDVFVC